MSTIVLGRGSPQDVKLSKELLDGALVAVKNVLEKPAVIAGATTEMFIASKLYQWINTLPKTEQVVAKKFAQSIEEILIRLTNMSDIRTPKRSRLGSLKGTRTKIIAKNMNLVFKSNMVEPILVKEQIIKYATEAASVALSSLKSNDLMGHKGPTNQRSYSTSDTANLK